MKNRCSFLISSFFFFMQKKCFYLLYSLFAYLIIFSQFLKLPEMSSIFYSTPHGISIYWYPPQVVTDFFFWKILTTSLFVLQYRKPDKTEEDEALDPCPFCSYPVRQTELDCSDCKQHLPYCVVTVSRA